MSELRSTSQRVADARAALERNGSGWLASASPSGQPHLIAVSTWWDGAGLVIATVGGSRTAQNLDRTRAARLGLGSPDDVVLVDLEVAETVPVAEADAQLAQGFAAAVGWSPAEEPGAWVFYRFRPLRVQAYRGYGELQGRQVMRGSRWLDG